VSSTNPFDDDYDPEPPAAEPEAAPAPVAAPARPVPAVDGKVVVTLKGGTGYDAPWVVIHAATVADAQDQLEDKALGALIERTKRVAAHFSGGGQPSGPARSASTSGGAPRPATPAHQEAPGGEERFCKHGPMKFRSGTSKAGNVYKGFFCQESNRDEQCKAQFIK
jgi:hypothetical protein